ncbi:MAG: helix-turn-helix transcriptional regulator [Acutalibacteraceae bacterium]
MPMRQPKRLLIMNILDILRRYTDEEHRLSQKEIADILKNEYDMTADRKAIRRNLLNLMDFGYNIEYRETTRIIENPKTGEPEESCIRSDFYLERDFTNGELRLLIDGLLFSAHVPSVQCKQLVEKLESLSNIYFHSRIKHISKLPDGKADNKQLFLNIELLDEAISKQRKVSFHYLEYGTDKKLYIKKRPDGTDREYIITPYQMAAKEGKYYLICNYDKYDDISNYRIDRISDIKILDEPAKPFESLKWSNGRTLNLAEYMNEHPYMYSSENVRVRFRINRPMISDVIDMFGDDVRFFDEDENGVTVSAYTNEMAMEQFAKNFAPDVVILEPQSLREKLKKDLEESLKYYMMKGIFIMESESNKNNFVSYELISKKAADFLAENFDIENFSLPEEYNYSCLPLCLIDAIFSIGVNYYSTRNTVLRYCEKVGIEPYKKSNQKKDIHYTTSDLIAEIQSSGIEKFAAETIKNRQRTSSKNGILKAEAVFECAKKFKEFGIETKADFNSKCNNIETEYKSVKGQSSGISFQYLKMLCGNENILKPDRHILRFLSEFFDRNIEKEEAQQIMEDILNILQTSYPNLTIRELDYLIWNYMRSR